LSSSLDIWKLIIYFSFEKPTQSLEYFLEWEDQLKACLLGTTAFLALLLVLVTCLCLNQKSRYKKNKFKISFSSCYWIKLFVHRYERQLKAATATVFGSETQLTRCNVPNTNQHASEGSNPMWMTGYDNHWYKDEEQIRYWSQFFFTFSKSAPKL